MVAYGVSMLESVTWKIGGEAGFGIITSGNMLARTFCRAGYFVFTTNEYPSLIRGGHNVITVRIATAQFEAMNRDVHFLVALNNETIERHRDELNEGAVVLFDPHDHEWNGEDFPKPVELVPLPLRDTVQRFHADLVMRNTVALGATVALLGAPFERLAEVIGDQFGRKGQSVVEQNVTIAKAGYDYIRQHFPNSTSVHLGVGHVSDEHLVMNGSEAVGVGAVRAGLKFAAIYPMTPINSLITFLADHARSLGIVYKQPEDEIAGINMAIGASVAGVRSMVATSGGGFALMVEGLSLAGMIEAPLVVDLGMRVGPATGMPTYTEQGELLFVISAGHGEFARIILAPADASEAYQATVDAFNLADRYQIPVFILTDKYLNESQWCVAANVIKRDVAIDRGKFANHTLGNGDEFKRYDTTATDGVSTRSTPGTKGGFYIANSYEHDENGYVTEEGPKRAAMAQKRLRKLSAVQKEVKGPVLYGDKDGTVTFLTWGSTRGPVLEALGQAKFSVNGEKANLLHYNWIYPFPTEETLAYLARAKRIIDVEQNATGQFAQLLKQHTGIDVAEKLLKFDGRPWYPEEILEKVKSP